MLYWHDKVSLNDTFLQIKSNNWSNSGAEELGAKKSHPKLHMEPEWEFYSLINWWRKRITKP